MTCARRCAAAFAATFWVRLMVENPLDGGSRAPGCAGDMAGEDDPVLLPLHWRVYTGLPVLRRSICIYSSRVYVWLCGWIFSGLDSWEENCRRERGGDRDERENWEDRRGLNDTTPGDGGRWRWRRVSRGVKFEERKGKERKVGRK